MRAARATLPQGLAAGRGSGPVAEARRRLDWAAASGTANAAQLALRQAWPPAYA